MKNRETPILHKPLAFGEKSLQWSWEVFVCRYLSDKQNSFSLRSLRLSGECKQFYALLNNPSQSFILKTPAPLIFPCFNKFKTLFASSNLNSWTSGMMGISAAKGRKSWRSFLVILATLFISFSSQRIF